MDYVMGRWWSPLPCADLAVVLVLVLMVVAVVVAIVVGSIVRHKGALFRTTSDLPYSQLKFPP